MSEWNILYIIFFTLVFGYLLFVFFFAMDITWILKPEYFL